MQEIILELTAMAHGGSAMGRDQQGRAVFVPGAIPGEKVRAKIVDQKRNFARATMVELIERSPNRVEPRCSHFGVCGGCHLQQMAYDTQLEVKRNVVIDQLKRIGNLEGIDVQATLATPTPWAYRIEISLSPNPEGGVGLWSPALKKIIAIEECHIIQPELLQLWRDFELSLPGLRKLTLRMGDDEALLAALEVDDVQPPELHVDFPLSVAIVLPNRTAASLVGDNFLVQSVKGRDFRVSPGCYFQPNPGATGLIVDQVMSYAGLTGSESVLEAYSGVGLLTAFLAEQAGQVIGIERNPDALADAASNLHDFDNISLYEGQVDEIVPLLKTSPDIGVVNPEASGLSRLSSQAIAASAPERLIYVSSDVATFSRDSKQLSRSGYRLVQVQPIDANPQTFHIDTVSLFRRR